jgi:hypothetical protein
MYMRLFHGRDDPMVPMEEWGFDGPVFQIKGFVHSTYNHLLWVDHAGTGNGDELHYVDDCVYYDAKYYGDWSVFEAELPPALQSALQPFDPAKALVPDKVKLRDKG